MRGLVWAAPLLLLVAGCFTPEEAATVEPAADEARVSNETRVFFHTASASDANGSSMPATTQAPPLDNASAPTDLPLPDVPAILAQTLPFGSAEPTLGITSNGYIFATTMMGHDLAGQEAPGAAIVRSTDGGATWEVVSTVLSSPTTLDPYLHVDPTTDRVFADQLYLGCSWLSVSDDYGATWITNPVACGIPVNDHQKITTGTNRGPVPSVAYPRVTYYAYNAIAAGSRVSISYDGGVTWPVNSETVPAAMATCNGGLHGNIEAAPDGTVYVPKRHCEGFILAKSTDSGLTWTQTMVGADAGGSECRKNPDLGIDADGNLYGAWPGKDNRLYLQRSTDAGETWLEKSLVASPPEVNMTTMPAVVAGSPGRFAIVYYGTSDGARGPDEVNESAEWHVYVTSTVNGLDAEPTFVTVRATEDPVQIGPVSTNSACASPPGSRNLLDFLDAQMDQAGRLYFSYTDGCVDACVEEPEMEKSRSARLGIGILQTGPSLLADVGILEALTEPTEA